jgi:carbonic anhydrase
MDIKEIFKNNESWVKGKIKDNQEYFNQLAEGQSPEIVYIGCADSRVTAEELMGVGPGDVFVHRNIANMVPNNDLNSLSVINYAVKHLKVGHVVVCGHYYCGGVKAAMQSNDLGVLNPWLTGIRDVFRLHKNELDAITDEEIRYKRLVELNVKEQCINLMKMIDVQEAYKIRGLKIHSWVFDIKSGKLIDLNFDAVEELKDIKSVFKLID